MMDIQATLRAAKKIVIISGAGLSESAGIPTFRDANGLWENFDINEVSHADADPILVRDFYKARLEQMSECSPTAAHDACAHLETLKEVLHITQNVDGLLEKAGCQNVINIHGSVTAWICRACDGQVSTADFYCHDCKTDIVRPDVVMFGEFLNPDYCARAVQAIKECNVLITVGTSGQVQPVSLWPSIAENRGIPVIAIGPTKPANYFSVWLNGKAEEVLPAIVQDLIKDRDFPNTQRLD